MSLIPELRPLVTVVVVVVEQYRLSKSVIAPVSDSITASIFRIIAETEECIQADTTIAGTPVVGSFCSTSSSLVTLRTMSIADITIDVHCKRNLKDGVIRIVNLIVTFVNEYLIPVLCKIMCTGSHNRVTIVTCDLIILDVVVSALHSANFLRSIYVRTQ